MQGNKYLRVTYRDIAIMLAKNLPLEGDDFASKVNDYLKVIKAMTSEAKTALKTAYVFSSKAPREEREDLFQELTLALLKARTKDSKLAYAMARCDWQNWWSKYKIRQHYSLDLVLDEHNDQSTEEGRNRIAKRLSEMVIGKVEIENRLDGDMDGERLFNKLPAHIKPLVNKRLIGKTLNKAERNQLNYYVRVHGASLLLA